MNFDNSNDQTSNEFEEINDEISKIDSEIDEIDEEHYFYTIIRNPSNAFFDYDFEINEGNEEIENERINEGVRNNRGNRRREANRERGRGKKQ